MNAIAAQPKAETQRKNVGIKCPHSPACGFVAVVPTVMRGSRPVEGHCPKCAKVIPLS
jgi:hypothetical protein